MVAGDEGTIEGIKKCILEKEGAREEIRNRRAFAKYEESSGYRGQWPTGEGHDGHLRHVGEEEHGGRDAQP